jgi:thioredoxin reductase
VPTRTDDPDVVVIGAGPSGLVAALAASEGTPWWSKPPERRGRVLVLEEHDKPGGIAAFGTLSITNRWIVKGGQLKQALLHQARDLPIEIRCSTPATALRREGDLVAVDTPSGTVRAPAVVLACGIFSHLPCLRYRNTFFLAETLPGQTAFLERAERAFAKQPERGRRLLLVGSHPALDATVERFRAGARSLAPEGLLDSRHDASAGALERRLREVAAGGDGAAGALPRSLASHRWNDGGAGVHAGYAAIVFDYNTYKLRPENAVRVAPGAGLRTKDGYVLADPWGRTNVPGVWACGNAVFPFSGILQALYTGFVAGVGARSATALAPFDEANGFLPWLAVPSSAWASWLAPVRELFP